MLPDRSVYFRGEKSGETFFACMREGSDGKRLVTIREPGLIWGLEEVPLSDVTDIGFHAEPEKTFHG